MGRPHIAIVPATDLGIHQCLLHISSYLMMFLIWGKSRKWQVLSLPLTKEIPPWHMVGRQPTYIMFYTWNSYYKILTGHTWRMSLTWMDGSFTILLVIPEILSLKQFQLPKIEFKKNFYFFVAFLQSHTDLLNNLSFHCHHFFLCTWSVLNSNLCDVFFSGIQPAVCLLH